MSDGRKILEGLQEAVAHAKGEATQTRVSVVRVPNNIDVRAIRKRLGMSQREFAVRYGFSLGTLRHWEQGRRHPEGPARVLLKVINHDPQAVESALAVG